MFPERKTESEMIPLEFHLSQNYPNPFNNKTSIKYCIAYKTDVEISVFNSKGDLVKRLVNANQEAGTYEIEFSAKGISGSNENGFELPNGVYFYQLKAGDYTSTKEMILNNW